MGRRLRKQAVAAGLAVLDALGRGWTGFRRWRWWGQTAVWVLVPPVALWMYIGSRPDTTRRPWAVTGLAVSALWLVVGVTSSEGPAPRSETVAASAAGAGAVKDDAPPDTDPPISTELPATSRPRPTTTTTTSTTTTSTTTSTTTTTTVPPTTTTTTAPATTTTTTAPPPPPTPPPTTAAPQPVGGGCDPNYTPCVPVDSDVDCAGGSGNGPSYVRGPVTVVGSDIYGLDRDSDGIGCEDG